jgi:hypothetical protein
MQKLLLIATLSLATFAWAQPMADNMANSQSADSNWYNQKVSQQADLNGRFIDAGRQDALAQSENFNGSDEPGSMASNAGTQNSGDDFYGQKVAGQASVNRLLNDSNRQEFTPSIMDSENAE